MNLENKNHQLCFLHKYASEFDNVTFTYNQLAFVFNMCHKTVSRSILKGAQDPKSLGRHRAFDEDIEEIIDQIIIEAFNEGHSMTQRQILSLSKRSLICPYTQICYP